MYSVIGEVGHEVVDTTEWLKDEFKVEAVIKLGRVTGRFEENYNLFYMGFVVEQNSLQRDDME